MFVSHRTSIWAENRVHVSSAATSPGGTCHLFSRCAAPFAEPVDYVLWSAPDSDAFFIIAASIPRSAPEAIANKGMTSIK